MAGVAWPCLFSMPSFGLRISKRKETPSWKKAWKRCRRNMRNMVNHPAGPAEPSEQSTRGTESIEVLLSFSFPSSFDEIVSFPAPQNSTLPNQEYVVRNLARHLRQPPSSHPCKLPFESAPASGYIINSYRYGSVVTVQSGSSVRV